MACHGSNPFWTPQPYEKWRFETLKKYGLKPLKVQVVGSYGHYYVIPPSLQSVLSSDPGMLQRFWQYFGTDIVQGITSPCLVGHKTCQTLVPWLIVPRHPNTIHGWYGNVFGAWCWGSNTSSPCIWMSRVSLCVSYSKVTRRHTCGSMGVFKKR